MSDLVDPDLIQELWPTLNDMTYLNNASTGIPPKTTIQAMEQFLHNRVRAIGDFQDTLRLYKDIRENLAKLLGGDYEQYGFVPSTSSGINSFAHAIDYSEDCNIVLCDLEFPANYVPWQNVRDLYGPELRLVESTEGAVSVDAFAELIDDKTRVVAVSQIQFGTGYRIDLEKLAKVAHSHGALLSVDIIQGAGCFDIDLSKTGADFAAGKAAKWMLGPIGAGYAYVAKSLMDDLHPRFLGWWGIQDPWDFAYFERKPFADARMFQVGSPTAVAYVGLAESLKTLLSIPSKNRQAKAKETADYLRTRLAEIGIPFYDFGPANNSATVSAAPEGVEEIQKQLMKERIHCSVRNGRLRVSPHFYNSREDIDSLLEHLR
jgi:selenocysteine lyase/cysteine desulfurase